MDYTLTIADNHGNYDEYEVLNFRVSADGYEIVKVVNVWSNGSKIRRYNGQGNASVWHNPSDCYRKMYAVLIEEGGD